MRHFFRRMLILSACVFMGMRPSGSSAYILPVIDVANLAQTTITAIQMILQVKAMGEQVANSDAEVAMMAQNLMATEGAIYPYTHYVNLLREVIDTVNRGEPMHYYLGDLNGRQLDLYRGYTSERKAVGWPANYALLVHTALNAQRGAFNTVHEELKPADDTLVNGVVGDLLVKTENAFGNKDLAQLNNYHNNLLVTELRRHRHMLGALSQAIMIKQEHDLDLQALAQHSTDNFYLASKFTVHAYSGAGGIRTLSLD